MASFAAQMKGWTDKARRNVDLVIKDSAQDVFELMTRRQPGVKETGGSYQEGLVPVDMGELINSVEVSVAGVPVAAGENIDYASALITAPAGASVEAVFTAPHARAMEYGTKHTAGRFFVRNAVQNWDQIVAANAARYR